MRLNDTIKDPSADRASYVGRVFIACLIILLVLGVILSRYYQLQLVEHERYQLQSERNRIQVRPIEPTRGLIYDRNGQVLAENWPSYALSVLPEKIKNIDLVIGELARRISVSDDEIKQFKKRLKRSRAHENVILKSNLSDSQIAKIAIDNHLLEGVFIEAVPLRHYPRHDVFAHSVGYVARISEIELGRVDPKNYANTKYIGKTGVERFYETLLHGQVGYENVETNARGRVLRVLDRFPAESGDNLSLHLDSHVQTVAYQALGNRRGAVVAIDVKTGGVLALVSTPGFNPNLFVQGISNKQYDRLNKSKDLPLFNRSVLGQYPPGSTVKPMVALAGLEYGIVTPESRVKDPGWYQLPNDERFYRDWKKKGHGHTVNLHQAIVESCDTYYYDLAYRMGIDKIHTFLSLFGFGQKTGIDLIGEQGGLLPSSAWKKRVKRLPWFPGETLNAGIGQGYMLATPLQLAVATATTANKGVLIQPRLLKAINGEDVEPAERSEFALNNETHWQTIWDSMEDVVHSHKGTAKGISRGIKYKMAGKTGTAQVVGIAQDAEYDSKSLSERNRDHALFISFAPIEDPQIAVAVIVENGEHGSSTAAPIARAVTDAWLN